MTSLLSFSLSWSLASFFHISEGYLKNGQGYFIKTNPEKVFQTIFYEINDFLPKLMFNVFAFIIKILFPFGFVTKLFHQT